MIDIFGVPRARVSNVAIDNIEFYGCARPQPQLSACNTGQVMCGTTGVCIDGNTLCDLRNDCGDGWDERPELCRNGTAMVCTFEDDMDIESCSYTLEAIDGSSLRWKVISVKYRHNTYIVDRLTGPLIDHTYRLANK